MKKKLNINIKEKNKKLLNEGPPPIKNPVPAIRNIVKPPRLPVINPNVLKLGPGIKAAGLPAAGNKAVKASMPGEFVYKPYDPEALEPEVRLMPKPPEGSDVGRVQQPDYDLPGSEVTPMAPVETPAIEPWESPLRLDDRQPLIAAREEEKLVNDLKNYLAQEYSSGFYKEKWLNAGIPEKIYDEMILPRVINKINTTPISISSQTPETLTPERWENANGVWMPPAATKTQHGKIQIRPMQQIRQHGGHYPMVTLAHEVGHAFSHDTFMSAIFNKFKTSNYNPLQTYLGDRAMMRSGFSPNTIAFKKAHGKSATQLDILKHFPPERQFPHSLHMPTSMAELQSYELDSLLDFGQRAGGREPMTPGHLLGYKWSSVGQHMQRGGKLTPEWAEQMNSEMTWRGHIEEIYADVKAVDAVLKRPMTGNDVRETCMGVSTAGSAAINAVPSFRDFLNCRNPEKAASIFNKIVQIAIVGTGAAAAASGGESQKLKENTQHKINRIVSEEIEKMLLEAPVIPASFADYLDTPHASTLRRKMDFLGTKHSLPYPQSMDVRPKEKVGGGYTDEFGFERQKGSQRVAPGEQLKHEIAMGGMNWKQGVPGYYLPWGGPKDPRNPGGAPRSWIYQGPGSREGGRSRPVPPQRMGGSDALDPRGYFQRSGKGKRTWAGVPHGKNKGIRYGYIPGSEMLAPIKKDARRKTIDQNLEDETWQNYRGRSSFFSEDSGDLDFPIVRTHRDPKTGEHRQTTIVPMITPEKSDWRDNFIPPFVGAMPTGYSSERKEELINRRMRKCAQDPKCVEKMKRSYEKGRHFPGAYEGFGQVPFMWPGLEGITDYWTGIQSPGEHRSQLPDEIEYFRDMGVHDKAAQKVFGGTVNVPTMRGHGHDPHIGRTRTRKRGFGELQPKEKEVASFNYWERGENKNRIPELLKKQKSGNLTDKERLELKGLAYIREFGKIANRYAKWSGGGYEHANPGYAGDVPHQFNALDLIEFTPYGIPAILGRGVARGGIQNILRDIRAGKSVPTGLGGTMDPWYTSPTLHGLDRQVGKGVKGFKDWRGRGGHLPWWPLKNAPIKYPQTAGGVAPGPKALENFDMVRATDGNIVYVPKRPANRGNLLSPKLQPEIVVKESLDSLKNVVLGKLQNLLNEERLNEEKQHIAVDITLKYNNDFSFYGYVLNQIRAIDGITIAKADEAGVVDISPERQQILLHLKFMPIGSLSRYFWYLKNELKKIQDTSGDKIDSVQIRGIPRQID